MKKHWFVCLLATTTLALHAAGSSYWQCLSHDNTEQRWASQHSYQKIALNFALASCRKQSKAPMTCKASVDDCEGFNQARSPGIKWRCTSKDQFAVYWTSTYYADPDSAGLAAQSLCAHRSKVPETCFVNLITCKNTQGAFY